jgi:hypothetical protein
MSQGTVSAPASCPPGDSGGVVFQQRSGQLEVAERLEAWQLHRAGCEDVMANTGDEAGRLQLQVRRAGEDLQETPEACHLCSVSDLLTAEVQRA